MPIIPVLLAQYLLPEHYCVTMYTVRYQCLINSSNINMGTVPQVYRTKSCNFGHLWVLVPGTSCVTLSSTVCFVWHWLCFYFEVLPRTVYFYIEGCAYFMIFFRGYAFDFMPSTTFDFVTIPPFFAYSRTYCIYCILLYCINNGTIIK